MEVKLPAGVVGVADVGLHRAGYFSVANRAGQPAGVIFLAIRHPGPFGARCG